MLETRLLLDRLHLDDAVGAIPVHLTGGIWGTFAVGLFGNLETLHTNLSRWEQIQVQALGIFSCALLSFGLGYIVLSLINKIFRLRVNLMHERQGLNYAEHRASTELNDLFLEMEYQRKTGDLSKNLSIEPFTEVGQIAERYNLVLEKIRSNIKERENLTNQIEQNLFVIQSDLSTARKIQSSILSPQDATMGKIDFAVRYIPLTEVGGDFFDIVELKEDCIRIFLADATGHGVQAALITMVIKGVYDNIKKNDLDAAKTMEIFNNEYIQKYASLNSFVTAILIDIDIPNQKLSYASAGHPPAILLQSKRAIELKKTGKLLGVSKDSSYKLQEYSLQKGDRIFAFTDGIFEEFNSIEEEFGEKRLIGILTQNQNKPIKDCLDKVLVELELFLEGQPKQDDITILGVEYNS